MLFPFLPLLQVLMLLRRLVRCSVVDADVPPPTTSDASNIRRTLVHVLTVQAAHGQILVDVLDEICALHAKLAQFRPPPF